MRTTSPPTPSASRTTRARRRSPTKKSSPSTSSASSGDEGPLRALYDYTRDHLADYFPRLPSYGGYVQLLNRLGDLFPALIARVLAGYPGGELIEDVRLIDSIPIILAGERRSGQAKVAPELANKGYCASKRMYFYGVKLHVLGLRRRGTMPVPEQVGLTPGSEAATW